MSQTIPIFVPPLGEGIDEATLVSWLVAPGQRVREGQAVALVETAKATLEVPSPATGDILDVLIFDGDPLPPGATVATLRRA